MLPGQWPLNSNILPTATPTLNDAFLHALEAAKPRSPVGIRLGENPEPTPLRRLTMGQSVFPPTQFNSRHFSDEKTTELVKPHDPLVLDEETVRGLLLRNDICRKRRSFPTVSDVTWNNFLLCTERLRTMPFDAPTISTPRPFGMGDFYPVNRVFPFRLNSDEPIKSFKNWRDAEAAAIQNIVDKFPLALRLLSAFYGTLIAAGGAVTKALCTETDNYHPPDIDFFFIDPDVERDDIPDDEKIIKQNQLLTAVVAFLADLHLSTPGLINPRVYIFRNEHVTTVYLSDDDSLDTKYQFIHRVYPNIGLVLGGFDIGAAAAACTGPNIVATEMGAFCSLAKIVIVDISRRSTSYESRLSKYNKRYHLIFPGLAYRYSIPKVPKPKSEVLGELLTICHENGMRIDTFDFRGVIPQNSNMCRDFESSNSARKATAIKAIVECAAAHGYEFDEGTVYLPDALVPMAEQPDLSLGTKEKLGKELRARAWASGYALNPDKFLDEVRCPNDHGPCGDDSMSALPVRFKMPRLVISQEVGQYPYMSRVRLVRDPSLRYTFSDYNDGYCQIMIENGLKHQCTDYNDTPAWPHLIGEMNLAYLLANKLENVASVLVLKTSKGRSVNSAEPEPSLSEASLASCSINIDTYQSTESRTRQEKITELVQKSFSQSQIGDVQLLLDAGMGMGGDHPQGPYSLARRAVSRKRTEIGTRKGVKAKLKEDLEIRMALRLSTLGNGPSWILRNAGTQWTGSINPIVGDPREWYGKYYQRFLTSDGQVETCLGLLRLRNTPFAPSAMARDIFRRIVAEVVWLNSLPSTWPAIDFPN